MTRHSEAQGPLQGVRVVEFAGRGPAPFCAMMLSDMGADVVRIESPNAIQYIPLDMTARGRPPLILDLKNPEDLEMCRSVMDRADVVIEGFRPGVVERLGVGPDEALRRNPGLVYGRMTGWGQKGPLSDEAGHDINFIALSGALHAIGDASRPPEPPLNLVGDFGGGAMYLAFGIAAALFEREKSGKGQVIDAAMIDGSVSLMTFFTGIMATNPAAMERGKIRLAGAAPNYRCYACRDGGFVAVGALETEFHAALLRLVGDPYTLEDYDDPARWPELAKRMEAIFATRDRDEWCRLALGLDACLSPVLSLAEAPDHPHVRSRGCFIREGGEVQPAPAPRFSRTPGKIQAPGPEGIGGGREILRRWEEAG